MSELQRGNLLWESSRMFLPEHKEQLLERRRKQREFRKPEWDEQELEQLSQVISEAVATDRAIRIALFDPYGGTRLVTGKIGRIDPALKRLSVCSGDDRGQWIQWTDILGMEICESITAAEE